MESYRYLGFTIRKDGEIEEDVDHRMRGEWLKLGLASRVLYNLHIPTKLKETSYNLWSSMLANLEPTLAKNEYRRDDSVVMGVWQS